MKAHLAAIVARWKNAGWREFVLLGCAVTFCAALWIFLDLAEDVPEGGYQKTEERVMLAFREPGNLSHLKGPEWTADAMRDITALGSGTVLTLGTIFVVAYLALGRNWRRALFVLIAVLGGHLLSLWLKALSERPRPTIVPHLADVDSWSFPSGHSMSSTIVYVTLAALLSRIVKQRRQKLFLLSAALLLSFLVGVSRVALGVHYPTDVLAGWTAGIAWALLCLAIDGWLISRRNR